MKEEEIILEINNLSFNIGNKNILNNLSFGVKKGSFVSIIGPNGSGKTSFLKNCLGLYSVKPNSIFIKGKDITKYNHSELSRIFSYIPQDTTINYDLTVQDIVLMGRIPYLDFFEDYSLTDYEIAQKVMKNLDIYHLKDSSIINLSGGERQKVFIAKALCQQAEIILLDEPISELDISNQINTINLLIDLNKKTNITILSVLHDINIALNYSKEILILKNGNLLAYEKPEYIINSQLLQNTFNMNIDIIKNKNKYFISI